MNKKLVWKIFIKNKLIEIGSGLLALLILCIVCFVCYNVLSFGWHSLSSHVQTIIGWCFIGLFLSILIITPICAISFAMKDWIVSNWHKAIAEAQWKLDHDNY